MTDIKETATAVNFTLMKLIALRDDNDQGDTLRPSPGMIYLVHLLNESRKLIYFFDNYFKGVFLF